LSWDTFLYYKAQPPSPKKSGPNPGARKCGLRAPREKLSRNVAASSSSDSYSGSTIPPTCPAGTPVSDDAFEDDDVNRLVKGKSKRKKVDQDDLAWRLAVKDMIQ
jgi:hypothetical protein